MLRTQPPEVYDNWVKNEIPFNDPAVVNAIDIFGKFATDDKMVDGGAAAVAATDFRDSPKGLFAVPPKCYLHHQASFIPSFFPEGTKLGAGRRLLLLPALCVEAGARQSGARRRHARHDHQGLAGGARLHRFPEDAARA